MAAAYMGWTQWYVRFLLEQVKSTQAPESNIWPADKNVQDTYAWCSVEALPALMLKSYKDNDLEEGQKKCSFNSVAWQGSREVNCNPVVSPA